VARGGSALKGRWYPIRGLSGLVHTVVYPALEQRWKGCCSSEVEDGVMHALGEVAEWEEMGETGDRSGLEF
jgi:hypothetical protein